MRPGPRNLITDVPGLRVGHAHEAAAMTGVTIIVPDAPCVMAAVPVVVDASDEEIRNYGTFAVVILQLTYTFQNPEKKSITRPLRATLVLRKIGKDWKIASSQVTDIRIAMPAAKPK